MTRQYHVIAYCRGYLYLAGIIFLQGLQATLKGNYDGQFIKCSDLNIMTIIGTDKQYLRVVMERMACL